MRHASLRCAFIAIAASMAIGCGEEASSSGTRDAFAPEPELGSSLDGLGAGGSSPDGSGSGGSGFVEAPPVKPPVLSDDVILCTENVHCPGNACTQGTCDGRKACNLVGLNDDGNPNHTGDAIAIASQAASFCEHRPGAYYRANGVQMRCPCQEALPCDAVGAKGDYRWGRCSDRCAWTKDRYTLWDTVYAVGNTSEQGQHQGVGVIGARYVSDPRFHPKGTRKDREIAGDQRPWLANRPWRNPSGLLWVAGDGASDAKQFEQRRLNPAGESNPLLECGAKSQSSCYGVPASLGEVFPGPRTICLGTGCATPEDENYLCAFKELISDGGHRAWNHGRTLSERVPDDPPYWTRVEDEWYFQYRVIPMAPVEVHQFFIPGKATGSLKWQLTTRAHYAERTQFHADAEECISLIGADTPGGMGDGFCDSRCGNCSYVLPEAETATFPGLDTAKYVDQTVHARQVETISSASFAATVMTEYAGGSSWKNFASEVVDAPWRGDLFTHCKIPQVVGSVMQQYWDVGQYGGRWNPIFPTQANFGAWPFNTGYYYNAPGSRVTRPGLTGKYGHNSNADFNAERMQFLNCAIRPDVNKLPSIYADSANARADLFHPKTGSAPACRACGVTRVLQPAAEQFPCLERTNTADLRVEVTQMMPEVNALNLGFTKGPRNRRDDEPNNPSTWWNETEDGPAAADWKELVPPKCVWADFRVSGM
jgi:hypothetical protein